MMRVPALLRLTVFLIVAACVTIAFSLSGCTAHARTAPASVTHESPVPTKPDGDLTRTGFDSFVLNGRVVRTKEPCWMTMSDPTAGAIVEIGESRFLFGFRAYTRSGFLGLSRRETWVRLTVACELA